MSKARTRRKVLVKHDVTDTREKQNTTKNENGNKAKKNREDNQEPTQKMKNKTE